MTLVERPITSESDVARHLVERRSSEVGTRTRLLYVFMLDIVYPIHERKAEMADHSFVRDQIIEARGYLGMELRRGQILRIVDVEGSQVPDLVCFNLQNPSERLSCNNSRLIQRRWRLTTGHALFSDEGNEMLTIVDDTVGVHHASGGQCNEAANFRRYGVRGLPNCLDNLAHAAAPLGIGKKQIPGAFCPFMAVEELPDGSYEIREPASGPGDYIDLRAEMDLFVAVSNCPQERNPCNGFQPTPLQVIVTESGHS